MLKSEHNDYIRITILFNINSLSKWTTNNIRRPSFSDSHKALYYY